MEKNFVLALTIVLCCHISLSSAIDGTATYYTSSPTPTSCFGYDDMGTMIAAGSETIWGNGGACGRHYKVTCIGAPITEMTNPCTGASVVVKIVDYCPACEATFDLSQEAFSVIADLNARKIQIDYVEV
ncbi:EG45-like domain containing protein [Phalaenopsis equestris]|uniref:EG45-like domain containing protein n=1 Tax=Phalaenopsis equestris TaxID=78828 RepID=UPI0009E2E71F|nr:EG45-like domain containing protein [Phalaenopsis equestris]